MREFLNAKTVVIAATARVATPKQGDEAKFVLPVREQPLMTAKAEAKKNKARGGIATLGSTDRNDE